MSERDSNATIEKKGLTRRQSLGIAGGVGAGLVLGRGLADVVVGGGTAEEAQAAGTCTLAPELTEGPFWEDERLNRSNVTGDRTGVPLTLMLNVIRADDGCAVAEGAWVDIWHCDAAGNYSDEPAGMGNDNTLGQTWLRGYQVTDSKGVVKFQTIYPGWYGGRAVHIHVRIRAFSGNKETYDFTTQLFFPQDVNNTVVASSGYDASGASTTNATDGIYAQGGSSTLLIPVSGSVGGGYTGEGTIALKGLPASGSVDAKLRSSKWVTRKGGTRALRLKLNVDEQVAASAKIKIGRKVLASKKVGALKPGGSRTFDVVVPDRVDAGKASLALVLTDTGANKRSVKRSVTIPRLA